MQTDIIKKLEEKLGKQNVRCNESMAKHTSFKVGGNAEIFINIETVDDMLEILKINEGKLPVTIIGNGTNLLVKDSGIKGIVVKYKDDTITKLEEEDTQIVVSSGIQNAKLAIFLQKNKLSGFEFAGGIPGTLGGAIYMNAGAFKGEIKYIVKNVTFLDLNDEKIYTISANECEFSYRSSIFKKMNVLILSATLKFNTDSSENIQNKMNTYREKRLMTQPLDKPSAGSTFKRGDDFITAELIDKAGLKGKKIGGAEISKKHAGFIVNDGTATAQDIIDLIEYTKKEIYNKYGKIIETEVRIIG